MNYVYRMLVLWSALAAWLAAIGYSVAPDLARSASARRPAMQRSLTKPAPDVVEQIALEERGR